MYNLYKIKKAVKRLVKESNCRKSMVGLLSQKIHSILKLLKKNDCFNYMSDEINQIFIKGVILTVTEYNRIITQIYASIFRKRLNHRNMLMIN